MTSRENAIAITTNAALEEYESEVVLIEATGRNGDWTVVFKVYGWLDSEWRVWDYEGGTFYELIEG